MRNEEKLTEGALYWTMDFDLTNRNALNGTIDHEARATSNGQGNGQDDQRT